MRHVIRFLVLLSLLLGASVVAPLTAATAKQPGVPPTVPSTTPAAPTGGATDPSGSPSGSATASGPASPSDPATTPSKSAPGVATPHALVARPQAAQAAPGPVAGSPRTTLTSGPGRFTLAHKATFGYSASRSSATFTCHLVGPRGKTFPETCRGTSQANGTTTGQVTISKLPASKGSYKFYVSAKTAIAAKGASDHYLWSVYSLGHVSRFVPRNGPTFNNPLGSGAAKRTNLTRVIRSIDAMPGYYQPAHSSAPCPAKASLIPGTIRTSAYSMTDESFAHALIAASNRCISVQVLMNNHLSRNTDPAWRHLEDALGTRVRNSGGVRRSFAHRCHNGCRGTGVLHTKMYLFNSTVPAPYASRDRIRNTVLMGSSNMTSNAAGVQWNDLYGVARNPTLFSQYLAVFNNMRRDKKDRHLLYYRTGAFRTWFWPQGRSADPYKAALSTINCRGANGGAGIGGRSIVYINMHAWFGTRGMGLARQVRNLYKKGCYVRVLYSFMSFAVFKKLHKGTGGRMSVRRTLFSHNGHSAYVYSHFKNISVSGSVGSDPSSWVTYTGSNNFTNTGTHFDEVMMRISSKSTYRAYRNHFRAMSRRLSSPVYANYSEPSGGGRAP